MATVTVAQHKLLRTNEPSGALAPTAFSAGDTVKIPMTDKNIVVRVTTTTAGNVTFGKGEGIAGVADLVIAGEATKEFFIQLDSSSYEVLSGANKGFCIMTPAVAGTISVVNAL
jgi:hypothetical protein